MGGAESIDVLWVLVCAALVMLIAIASVIGWLAADRFARSNTPEFAVVLPDERPLPEFSLLDQDGNAFSPTDFAGRWSVLFFGLQNPGWAAIEIVVLWLAILVVTALFFRHSKWAAALMIPYMLWVSFASILNYSIWSLN